MDTFSCPRGLLGTIIYNPVDPSICELWDWRRHCTRPHSHVFKDLHGFLFTRPGPHISVFQFQPHDAPSCLSIRVPLDPVHELLRPFNCFSFIPLLVFRPAAGADSSQAGKRMLLRLRFQVSTTGGHYQVQLHQATGALDGASLGGVFECIDIGI